jgi:hypothetical protein
MTDVERKLVEAVRYALRSGCFFPVPEPRAGATVDELTKWGAMRNLHDAMRAVWSTGEGEQVAKWQAGKPPNEQLVEVEDDGVIICVMAIWGRDGVRPHWATEDRSILWGPAAFRRWRKPAGETAHGQ